jgi:hypothetical protein
MESFLFQVSTEKKGSKERRRITRGRRRDILHFLFHLILFFNHWFYFNPHGSHLTQGLENWTIRPCTMVQHLQHPQHPLFTLHIIFSFFHLLIQHSTLSNGFFIQHLHSTPPFFYFIFLFKFKFLWLHKNTIID